MSRYNPQEAARLQALVDGNATLQAALAEWRRRYGNLDPADLHRRRRAALELEALINSYPELRQAGLGSSSMGEGYQLNSNGRVELEPGEWGDMGQFLLAGAGMAGGGAAGGSAAGGAAGGLLPSSSIPTSLAMNAVPGAASTLGGGVAGAMSGGALGGLMPGAGAAAGAGLGSQLLQSLMSPGGLATAGSIAAMLANRGDGSNDQTRASEEQARRLQAITEARMRRVDPLHEAVSQMAFNRLPTSARQGFNMPRVSLPE